MLHTVQLSHNANDPGLILNFSAVYVELAQSPCDPVGSPQVLCIYPISKSHADCRLIDSSKLSPVKVGDVRIRGVGGHVG